jgi:hypothetical protein
MATQARATQVLSVLNPEAPRTPDSDSAAREVASWQMAPRLDTLNDKTVYLVNQGFGGSADFMEQFAAWFAEHMPAVKTVVKRKTGFIFRDDTSDLWQEIKEKGDAVIFGVAG